MLAKINEDTYLDIDHIDYIELTKDEDGNPSGVQLLLNGSPMTFKDLKVGQRVLDSYLWQHQNGIYNMIEDTEGYRKKMMNE